MEELAERFRQEARGRTGRIYSQELRQLAVEYAGLAKERGHLRGRIAKRLGVSETTLVEWLRCVQAGGSVNLVLHEVSLVEEVLPSRPVLVMPSGIRVEDLSARDLVAILGALG